MTLDSEVVAFLCHPGEPGAEQLLVYARDAREVRRLVECDCDRWQIFRHPPADGLRYEPGPVSDEALLQRAGLMGQPQGDGLECPSCGLILSDDAADPAPCLCPACGFRICEGQV